MKEELLKVLNNRLENVNSNISSLNNINDMLDFEDANLKYVERVLDIFRTSDEQYEIKNFGELSKEDFDRVMELVPETTKDKFETNSCNYDGLVYLIDGIKNGISLTLTSEQEEAVKLMLNGLNDKKMEYEARIEGITLAKEDLEEKDLEVLEKKSSTFENILDELDNDNYVSEVDSVMEAIQSSGTPDNKTVEMLGYLLSYNANIYDDLKENGGFRETSPFHNPDVSTITLPDDEEDEEEEKEEKVEEKKEETTFVPDFYKEDVKLPTPEEDKFELPEEPKDHFSLDKELTPFGTTFDLPVDETNSFSNLVSEDVKEETKEEEPEETKETKVEPEEKEEPTKETENYELPEEPYEPEMPIRVEGNSLNEIKYEEPDNSSKVDIPEQILNSLINNEEPPKETTSTINEEELKKVLEDYHIKYDDIENNEDLLKGDIENYKDILNIFKDNDLLSDVAKNEYFLKEVLANADKDIINEVLDIVRRDFSIDEEDFYETARITIDSMPSIFVREPDGNYENFMKNIEFFKKLNLDLITLFDFSRELLLVDNALLVKNCELVSKYDIKIETKNAKYLLALNNSIESIDYYMEAVYDDRITKKTFDGINIVKTYPSKLDTVTDLTIKRLRYSSENGKKMFGSRENSIAGEIANLKVDVLNIPEDYFRRFFNNEFVDISPMEVENYKELINNNTNYHFSEDSVLALLNKYRNGYRYLIAGVNVSYNKVLRNYNILINNNIDKNKALEFAVCYNLVITKEEYENVLDELKVIGG